MGEEALARWKAASRRISLPPCRMGCCRHCRGARCPAGRALQCMQTATRAMANPLTRKQETASRTRSTDQGRSSPPPTRSKFREPLSSRYVLNRMGALRCRGRAMRARGPNTHHAPLFLGLGRGLATDLTKHLDSGDAMLGMGSLTWLTHRHAQPPLRHQKGREGSSGRQQKPAPKSKQRTRQIRWC